jgi:hypothetical protein
MTSPAADSSLHLGMRHIEGFGDFSVELLAVGSKVLKNCGIHPTCSCGT